MAEVTIQIAGRDHTVWCRDGGEEHLRDIARLVDAKAQDVQRAVGGVNETRQFLLAAILLADELNDLKKKAAAAEAPPHESGITHQALLEELPPIIEKLAERLESVAERLEQDAPSA